MVTTFDKLGEKAASVAGRVAETARHAESLAKDALDFRDRAADAIEDSLYSAKRTVTHTIRELEDLKRDAETRVRKAPLRAVGATFVAGLLVGVALGWLGQRVSRPNVSR